MQSNAIPIGIISINILLLIILIWLFSFLFYKCFRSPLSKRENAFYKFKLQKVVIYLIANLCAGFVNYILFVANPAALKDLFGAAITYIRFIDRVSMLLLGAWMIMDVFLYHPAAFDDLISQDEFDKISSRFNKKATG